MHKNGVPPSAFTFSSVLSACGHLPAIQEGKQIHDRIIKSRLLSNKVLQTALLDMYAKCGLVDDARYVFDEMLDRDVVSWITMVADFAKAGLMKDARRVFDEMPKRNVVSWTAMVAGYANSGEVSAAREIFNEMLEKNALSWTTMIVGYGKCGDVRGARQVFDEICVPDATSWAAMIARYAHNGFSSEAIEMYWKMRSLNVKANEMGAISSCTQLGDPFFLLLDFSS